MKQNKIPRNEYIRKPVGKTNPYKDDVIYSNLGQWKYPGQVTRIPSGDITMQGVPYPVYGEDNLGYSQMMYPGMDYQFPGQYVTEYPQHKVFETEEDFNKDRLLEIRSKYWPTRNTRPFDTGFDIPNSRTGPGPVHMPSVTSDYKGVAMMYGGDPSLSDITGHYPFGGQNTKTHTHMSKGGWLDEYQKGGADKDFTTEEQIENNKNFLKEMIMSPLFEERWAKMTGKDPDQGIKYDKETNPFDYQGWMLNNLDTVKYRTNPKALAKENNLGMYEDDHKIIQGKEYNPLTDLHELSHASTRGELKFNEPYTYTPGIEYDSLYGEDYKEEKNSPFKNFKTHKDYVEDYYNKEDKRAYFTDPSEIKARVDVGRRILQKEGSYDPIKSRFEEKDYNNLKKYFKENSDIKELMMNYSKDDVIRMMNSIVSNNPKSQSVAKYGGWLDEYQMRGEVREPIYKKPEEKEESRTVIYTDKAAFDKAHKAEMDSLNVRKVYDQSFKPGSKTRPLTKEEKEYWKDKKTGLVPNLVEYDPRYPNAGYFGHFKKPVIHNVYKEEPPPPPVKKKDKPKEKGLPPGVIRQWNFNSNVGPVMIYKKGDQEVGREYYRDGKPYETHYGDPTGKTTIDTIPFDPARIKKEGGWLDHEEFRRGGPYTPPKLKRKVKKQGTSKNIQSSINKIFTRNYDVFGPGGKNIYNPNVYKTGGWLDNLD